MAGSDPAPNAQPSRPVEPLDASLAAFSGVGPKRLVALENRGLRSFRDALLHLPYRYEDLRRRDRIANLRGGMTAVVEGRLDDLNVRPMRGMRWRRMTTAALKDQSGARLKVAWFNLHGDGRMPVGEPVLLFGRVTADSSGHLEMLHPEVFRSREGASLGIRPIYSLPTDVSSRLFMGIVEAALRRARGSQLDAIPPELRQRLGLPNVATALGYLHQPPLDTDLKALEDEWTPAHQALVANELFAFQLAMALDRARTRRRTSAVLDAEGILRTKLTASLSFVLTTAQQRAIAEIDADLAAPAPMNRILIGDVGSGKTLVAFAAILRAIESGWQAVVMAPTELLAEQHFRNFTRMCGPLGIISALITGRLTGAERARMLRALARGDIAVAFGTHALVQEGVKVGRLGLAVIDEQHRFGVFDRARLLELGSQANVLLMTATPIPRSLALTLFRNLEVSALDESPPGRTPVLTRIFDETELNQVDKLLRAELAQGHRAYYVLPLIDGEEDDQATVKAAAKRLTSTLSGFRVGILHGRMRPADKERVMREFRDGALELLVATTVIEVGVDVSEATVIVVIAAERYGLAQLHQLRGRVGRGQVPSQCCLVVSANASDEAKTRLEKVAHTANGNQVAELDLLTRGPGDLFGARQTGALPLRFSSFIRDLSIVERTATLAEEWLKRDPSLTAPGSLPVVRAIRDLQAFGFSLGNIG